MALKLLTGVSQVGKKALQHPAIMQRVLLVGVLWGAVSFLWGSIAENALTNRLPLLFTQANRNAAEVADYLQHSTDILTSLTDDPRLIVGLSGDEGTNSKLVMRAMYEFSYLNKLSKIWVYNGRTDNVGGLATSGQLPEEVKEWLKTLPANTAANGILLPAKDELVNYPYTYYAAKSIPGSNGGMVVVRLSAQNMLVNWPPRRPIEDFAQAQQGVLGTGGKSTLWIPLSNISDAEEQTWFSGSRGATDYARGQDGDVWVWSAVPNQPGWRVAIRTPLGNALGEGRNLQWLLLLGTILASVWILWQPTIKIRRKAKDKIQKVGAPVFAAAGKAMAPAFKMARNVKQKIQKEVGINNALAEPGEFDAHDFKNGNPKRTLSTGPTYVTAKRVPIAPLKPAVSENPAVPATPIHVTADQAPTVSQLLNGQPATAPVIPEAALERMVDDAIIQRRIKLLYQPIYDAHTGLPSYHEVLARLGDPEGNWMTPQVFIPVLQKFKWMPRLDALVFGHILETYGDKGTPETPLTLNISGASIDNVRYLDRIMELKDIPVLHNLVFEVSSKELLEDPGVMRMLLSTKSSGVKLSVDYFGGGNSMLEASKQLGFDYIKINTMRFSESDATKKDLIVLCRTAQRIGLPVVLEKIETVAMEVFARKLGVTYLQGYQLSRPLEQISTETLPSWRANSGLDGKDDDLVPEKTV